MTAYLIRHAHAGSRSAWNDGPDRARPLSKKGRRQAGELVAALADAEPKRLLSSAALRCQQTLEPLSQRLGLKIVTCDELFERSDPTETIALIEKHRGDNLVISTHGDIIPDVIQLLIQRGMTVNGPTGNRKASIWTIELDADRFVSATYQEPI
jgi:phosphohistidine phosphatase SixA